MVKCSDYSPDSVAAAKSVLVELVHLLAQYRDGIVLVGGWVPYLLLPQGAEAHVGSLDIDLALDHHVLQEAGYQTIRALLLKRGYREGDQPFIFYREVPTPGEPLTVEVDLLAGEYQGTGKGHRTQPVQDVRARKARGCDLVFDAPVEIIVAAPLPDGGRDTITIRVASLVPFMVMKGMALHSRLKSKDAYDIYFCVRNYSDGVAALAEQFRPHMQHSLVREGLRYIANAFASPADVGPTWVADFQEVTEQEGRELLLRDAYERVTEWLQQLDVS